MPVYYCALDFCPSKFGDPVSFHKFPRDDAQRNAWIDFVRATGRHFWTPGKSSVISSLHFCSDAYESKYAVSFGIPKKRWLVSGAVPMVYPAAARSLLPSESGASSPKRQCVAEVESDGVDLFEETTMEERSSSTEKKMQSPNHRATWTDEETEVLIRLWEENLGGLRGQKRNGKIYESMTAALARCGIVKTRAQVHSKMENLRSKYRCHTKNRTTGSGGVPWRFYWKLHKFLGTLPANDASLAVESSCGELSVSEIVRSMETGQSGEELDLWTTYELPVEVPSPQTVEIEEGALGDLVFGSLAVVTSTCQDGHVLSWHSQPKMKRFAMGNVALAAAILFTGSSPTQVLRLFQSAGIACFSKRTYDHLQRDIMIPAVHQSNEVTSSGAMELEGLKRALKGLEDQKVCVCELVTDRHTQVRKHTRQNRPDIAHLIDAWHVTKGLKKKLQAVSRSRGCGVIEKWETSIINHFYFSVRIAAARVMTAERRGELAVAIWLSLLNHIQNKHCGHSKEYANCEHGDLLPRKWIFPGYVGLLLEIVNEVVDSGSFGDSHVTTLPTPPPLTSSFGPVDKAALVRGHLSRFASSEDRPRHTEDSSDDSA
ncbi:hypothetical protein HPB49_013384 [Dermacentor silvarum]|uniref:Uncharacterized protein n=1 Tax=Dermacentor silvarum TaxID=543639 RepID=A0ACB8C3V6_DERSI|nr:hypothetical protein HPB49_013384 [Dermacentor silvarum]